MKYVAIILISQFVAITAASAQEIELSFEWGDIPLCTSGTPNVVSNPIFKLSAIPEGATWVHFNLRDFESPYKHGGGWVELDGNFLIESGKFQYDSPCPPSGFHTYEWTASFTAKKTKIGWSGKPTGVKKKIKAKKRYPE